MTRLQVPYFAQWASPELVQPIVEGQMTADRDPLWRTWGAGTRAEYAFWSWRGCGIACLQMVLGYEYGTQATAKELKDDCVDVGAYVVKDDRVAGLIYRPFTHYARNRWGLSALVETNLTNDLAAQAVREGNLVMLSVHPSIRNPDTVPEQLGGHLVLVVGEWAEGLLLHNPSGFATTGTQRFASITFEALAQFSAQRGVIFNALNAPG
jgi:hypothetical protein